MRTIPPTISALPQQREPNFLPMPTPTKENKKVIIPIETTEASIKGSVDAPTAVGKMMPVASASILVATAKAKIVLNPGEMCIRDRCGAEKQG